MAPAHTASHAAPGSSSIAGVVVVAVFAAAFALLVFACLRASGDDEEGDSGWGGGGGNVPTGPRGPVDQGDGPVWWPEFERQFAAWVEQTQRAEPVVVAAQPG